MKEAIAADGGPAPAGPYSPAIRANGFVFVSGQVPVDPESGQIVRDSIQAQAARTLDNLKIVLEAAGSSLDKVVRATVYLSDMRDFEAVNEVYQTYFADSPPARVCVQVAALPGGVDIEIDAIALE